MKKYVLMGAGFSLAIGIVYFVVLDEPGAFFYFFAALAFLGGPLVVGVASAVRTTERKLPVFLAASGLVFGLVLALFILMYVVVPQFERTGIKLPAACDGSAIDLLLPAALVYQLPENGDTGILVAGDAETAVVTQIAPTPPYPSEVYIVNKNNNHIVSKLDFPNDAIMAAVDGGIVYLYNDKLGALLDARTGAFQENILLIDNYGGLSQTDRPILMGASDGNWYVETGAVISSWGVDGSVHSRPHISLNAVARSCFVNGQTGEVTKLSNN
jgi:hypothetical protein